MMRTAACSVAYERLHARARAIAATRVAFARSFSKSCCWRRLLQKRCSVFTHLRNPTKRTAARRRQDDCSTRTAAMQRVRRRCARRRS
eukprot:1275576-Pleurochrysis_carterae.AAC.3